MVLSSSPKRRSGLPSPASGVLGLSRMSKLPAPPSRRSSRLSNLTTTFNKSDNTRSTSSGIASALTPKSTFEAAKRSLDESTSSFLPEKKKDIINNTTNEHKSPIRRKSSANSLTPCPSFLPENKSILHDTRHEQKSQARNKSRKLSLPPCSSAAIDAQISSSRRKSIASSLSSSSSTTTSTLDNEEAVKVGVRIKPLLENDNEPRAFVLGSAENTIVKNVDSAEINAYQFNHVYGETSSTQQLYDEMASDIVESVGQGRNGTIFTYGQTSTGKTYTMHGVLMAAGKDLFGMINDGNDFNEHGESSSTSLTSIRISCMELYNEELRDLLRPSAASLSVQEDRRGNVQITNLSERTTGDVHELMEVIQIAEENRTVGSTAMNEQSSRSHTIFRITYEKKEAPNTRDSLDESMSDESEDKENNNVGVSSRQKVITTVSTLNLVDLAGSESVRVTGAKGGRQKEGGKINQSLLTLSRVLAKLGKKDRGHINYRDSKLTRILKPSLSGNARMGCICCISPSMQFSEESKSTLDFACRTMLVTTNAKSNQTVEYDDALVEEFAREIERVKMETAKAEESRLKMQLSLKDAEDEIVCLRAKIEFEKGKVSCLERGNSDYSNQVEELKSCHDKNAEKSSREIGELRTRNQELEANVTQLDSEKNRLEAQRDQERDAFDRERKRLEEQHAMLKENHVIEFQTLETKAKEHTSSKEEMETMYKEMKAEMDSTRKELQGLRTSAEESLKEIGELKARNQELEANVAQLDSEKNRLEAQRDQDRGASDRERKRLEEEHALLLESRVFELQNLKKEAKEYKASKEEVEAMYNEMKAELDSNSDELQGMVPSKSKNNDNTPWREELELMNAGLAGQHHLSQHEIAVLKSNMAALSAEKLQAEQRLEKEILKAQKRKDEAKLRRQKFRCKLVGMSEVLKEDLVQLSYQKE